ncbi:MAG: polysialyltransferase family glycosyltransferase [Oscillospiraceae bacterium]
MDIYSYDDLKELIKKNLDLNVIAFIKSPWQLHGVNAFLYHLIELGVSPKGFVCIERNAQYGYVIDEEHRFLICDDLKFIKYDHFANKKTLTEKLQNSFNIWRACICENKETNGEKVYILQCLEPNFNIYAFLTNELKRNASVVMIDEGIGSYMRSRKEMIDEALSYHRNTLKRLKIRYNHLVKKPILFGAMKKKGIVIDFQLFEKNENTVLKRSDVAKCYSAILNLTKENIPEEESELYNRAVVINTQPFFEMGQIKNDEDIMIIESISKICNSLNCKCVIKPHPREMRLDRYEAIQGIVIDLNKSISQETLFASIEAHPLMLIGFSSTTLVTAQTFFGIKTVSLSKMISENVGDRMKNDCLRFYSAFNSLVACPSELQEITKTISLIKRSKEEHDHDLKNP